MGEEAARLTYRIPILDGKNYALWKKQIRLVLRCKKLDKCLSPPSLVIKDEGAGDVQVPAYSEDEDRDCLAFINGYMNTEQQLKVVSCETAWETWERLQAVYENRTPANVGKIFEQYYAYRKSTADDMSSHISKVESLALQLQQVGEKQSEISIMAKLLYSLPDDYNSLKAAWESVHTEEQTRRNLVARLLAHEAGQLTPETGKVKEVALTSHYHNDSKQNEKKKRVKCYNCGKQGHYSRDCRSKLKHEQRQQDNHGSSSVALVVGRGEKSNRWVVDSGASQHTCCRRDWFKTFTPTSTKLQVGNEEWVEAVGIGSIHLICDTGNGHKGEVILKNVLYIPKMSYNLFSTVEAARRGATITLDKNRCIISHSGRTVALGTLDKDIGVLTLNAETQSGVLMLVSTRRSQQEWHKTFGHVDQNVIMEMANNKVVDGMELIQRSLDECVQCPAGKGTRASHTTPSSRVPLQVGDQVDMDLVGPVAPSLGGNKYMIIAIDKFSSYTWVCPIKSKKKVCNHIQNYIGQFEVASGQRIKCINVDQGSEFYNNSVRTLLGVEHIQLRVSSVYTPQQNGLAERNNRYVVSTLRTMMLQGGMPMELWGQAATTAAYLLNRVPRRGAKVTPYEMFKGRRPFVGHLVPFGTPVQSLINDRRLGKFDPRTEPGFIVGFTDRTNTYQVYLPKDNRVKQTCDVIFRQHLGCLDNGQQAADHRDGASTVKSGTSQNVLVEFFRELDKSCGVTQEQSQPNESENTINNEHRTSNSLSRQSQQEVSQPELQTIIEPEAEMEEIESPSFSMLSNYSPPKTIDDTTPLGAYSIDAQQTGSPFNGRSIPRSPPKGPGRTILLSCNSPGEAPPPQSYGEAVEGPNKNHWRQAIASELLAHRKNRTWSVVKRPGQGVLLSTKWVFSYKRDGTGNIEKCKARLVARGFQQEQGVNYEETYSPVTRRESIRVLLAVAAAREMAIERFDVSTAFLNGQLEETVLIEPPEGVKVQAGECLKLDKALYGLKQSPRIWSSLFDKVIKSLGFSPTISDPCVYANRKSKCFVSIYVDDGIIIGPNTSECIKIINELNKNFETKRITSDIFLGMQITRVANGYHLNQARYVDDMLKNARMEESVPVSTPLVDTKILFTKDKDDGVANTNYRALIGSLNYIAYATRPDILFTTTLLARFNEAPKKVHLAAVKHTMKYLKGTKSTGLLFQGPHKEITVEAYCDADWAGDEVERKSTSGLIIMICGSPVVYSSRLQRLIAQSSTEAEFVAACDAAKEITWLTGLLGELGIEFQRPTLFIDNKSTIQLIKNQDVKRRSRHIELRYFFVRQQYKENKFNLEHVQTGKQVADFLTKRLGVSPLEYLTSLAGIVRKV